MLVFISDLHLADGTSGTNTHPNAFHIFAERLRYLATRASYRADGSYRPIDRLDLVLLGDTLDLIRSSRWLQGHVRPWSDPNARELIQTLTEIIDAVLACNEPSLAILRSFATSTGVCVAPAGRNRQPQFNAPPQPVPVRIYYLVGNSDWPLHVAGRAYDLMRQKVAHHMGLASPLNEPFPHDALECDVVLESFRRHRVFGRHGDVFDPIHFAGDRSASSLGDALAIELIGRFTAGMQQLRHEAPPALLAGLRELDHIRPVLLTPVWIEGLLERTCPSPALKKRIKRTWDQLADEFLQMDLVREQDAWSASELIDGLERALKFSKRPSLGWASKIVGWLNSLRGTKSGSYYEHALAEPEFRNRRARHIVYGHTHQPETVPLDASFADGYVLNQVYFNTGTWRRVYQPTHLGLADHEFIPVENMSFLAFFEGDERRGRPFEMWTGLLGVGVEDRVALPPVQPAIHPAARPAAVVAPPLTAPHFGNGSFARAAGVG